MKCISGAECSWSFDFKSLNLDIKIKNMVKLQECSMHALSSYLGLHVLNCSGTWVLVGRKVGHALAGQVGFPTTSLTPFSLQVSHLFTPLSFRCSTSQMGALPLLLVRHSTTNLQQNECLLCVSTCSNLIKHRKIMKWRCLRRTNFRSPRLFFRVKKHCR